jgi:hypothetical protein
MSSTGIVVLSHMPPGVSINSNPLAYIPGVLQNQNIPHVFDLEDEDGRDPFYRISSAITD